MIFFRGDDMGKSKKRPGRKSKWDEVRTRLPEIEGWLKKGLTEAQVCKNLGVAVSTFNDYKKRYPELMNAIKRGKQTIITEIENALIKRALGYEYEEVKTYIKRQGDKEVKHIEKVQKHMPADVGACAILLKNKAPDEYTDNKALLNLKKEELALRKMIEEAKNW